MGRRSRSRSAPRGRLESQAEDAEERLRDAVDEVAGLLVHLEWAAPGVAQLKDPIFGRRCRHASALARLYRLNECSRELFRKIQHYIVTTGDRGGLPALCRRLLVERGKG